MNIFILDINPVLAAQYRGDDVVEAYRRYYAGEKAGFARWTNRNIPQWFIDLQGAIA